MLSSSLIALAALGVASAAPSKCHTKGTKELVTFEDVDTIKGTVFNKTPLPYKGLNFQGFTVSDVIKTDALPGPVPHSGTKYLVAATLEEATNGTPTITVDDTKTQSFDINDLYFACDLNIPEGATSPPTSCSIDITGYKGDVNDQSNVVCEQRLEYKPTTALGPAPMQFGKVSDKCKGLTSALVEFGKAGAGGSLDGVLAVALDDIHFTINKCSN